METKELVNALRGLYITVDYAKYIEPGLNFESLSKAADRLEELESKQENLIDYNEDLNNRLDKAESYIEKLEKQLSEKQEWISVEDERKPKHLHNYFVAYVFGVCDEHFFGEAMYIADKGNGIVDGAHFNDEGVDGMRVTHWMEIPKLPEPPKQMEPNICKYRKKPIVVEAYQTDRTIVIPTLEGDMIAGRGDYIITGVDGEKYPCKPDIFEKTYEPCFEEEGEEDA